MPSQSQHAWNNSNKGWKITNQIVHVLLQAGGFEIPREPRPAPTEPLPIPRAIKQL